MQVNARLGDRQLADETRVLLLQLLNAPLVRMLVRGGSRFGLARYALFGTFSAPLLQLTAVKLLASQQRAELAARAGVGFVQNPQLLRRAETATGPLLQLGRRCHLTVRDIAGWFGHRSDSYFRDPEIYSNFR